MNSKLLSMFAAAALSLGAVSCANDDAIDPANGHGTGTTGKLTTFTARIEAPATRTSFDYGTGSTGKYFWEAGDKIWVLDDTHTWQTSSNAVTGSKVASFKFTVPGTFGSTPGSSYQVVYHSNATTGDQVEIATNPTQTAPDNITHLGQSDFGIATATDNGTDYVFRLAHKAAILVFQPYTSNPTLQNCYLTKVEVTADNDIAGTFTINPTTGQLSGTGSNKITLTTQGASGSATEHGFPLTSATNAATGRTNCGAYMVIKPGTHKLRVRYWVESPTEQMEYQGFTLPLKGCITRYYSGTYNANGYYDLSANLTVVDYSYPSANPLVAGTKAKPIPYYMWDAQQPYWKDHEWNKAGYAAGTDQPTSNNQTGSARAQNNADPLHRWYHENPGGVAAPIEGSVNDLFNPAKPGHIPNANEMSWYVMKGDPHWDGQELWMTMGKFYKGGMWLKKAAKIAADEGVTLTHMKDKAADNTTDLRTAYTSFDNTLTNLSSNPIPTADAGNYFYLPALGYYGRLGNLGNLDSVSAYSGYWSSSASPDNPSNAYLLSFGYGVIAMDYNYGRDFGFSVRAFE